MAQVELAAAAVEDLDGLIRTLSLPADTRQRVKASLAPVQEFPQLGAELEGRWSGLRFLLGPWRWMLLVYQYDDAADRVVVVTIQEPGHRERPLRDDESPQSSVPERAGYRPPWRHAVYPLSTARPLRVGARRNVGLTPSMRTASSSSQRPPCG